MTWLVGPAETRPRVGGTGVEGWKQRVKGMWSGLLNVPLADAEDARRRKLLNILLIGVEAVAVLTVLAIGVASLVGVAGTRDDVMAFYLGAVAVLTGAAVIFAVNRYGAGWLASWLFLLLLTGAIAVSDRPQEIAEGRGLFLFTVPIIMASVLLPPYTVFVMTALCSIVVSFVGLGVQIVPNVGAFAGFFVIALVSWLSARSLNRALEDLRAINRELDQRVVERTRELEEAQEQLVRKEKLATLGQLAGGVGHELRNPLGAIKNAVYFLDMVLEVPDPDVQETLGILAREVSTSERIISSLLDYARVRSPVRRQVNLNDLLQETVSRMDVPDDVEIVFRLDDALPFVVADPEQLVQVFGNIILNGCQAMPAGGQLVIGSRSGDSRWVEVSVTDTGVGISEDGLSKLFEPLFTTKAKGIGLGLPIVKGLVEGHQGVIDVESEVGKGSTFTVRLPRSAGPAEGDNP